MLWKVRMVWPVFSMYRWHSPYTAGRAAAASHADWEGNYNSDCQTYIATTHTVNTLGHTTMCSGVGRYFQFGYFPEPGDHVWCGVGRRVVCNYENQFQIGAVTIDTMGHQRKMYNLSVQTECGY